MDGVMFNKDVTHSKMRRKIENPRVLLLDCPLEYKKGEVRSKYMRRCGAVWSAVCGAVCGDVMLVGGCCGGVASPCCRYDLFWVFGFR